MDDTTNAAESLDTARELLDLLAAMLKNTDNDEAVTIAALRRLSPATLDLLLLADRERRGC